jgi:hypothetical protein
MYNGSDLLKLLFVFSITVSFRCKFIFSYIDVIEPKELFPEVWQIPCETSCMLHCEILSYK